ncbi:MAG TPA: salicylate hydroxylase [Pusillimonas sp.]|jgi:salicylate hydroxylase|nr:salicylate hydroxylase [Pusillimonas sp.]HBT33191.1 salicylate hydroxylase [Pusillimonas sp.]HCN71790.1 salicylate hydroxylase [Pusillimonas sp.]HCP78098.1 salicylate hydroxylase [Pusillimonas sp.]|tara:strand:+ start:72924 stop:74057 length:1134 start_codon:yes stop_codon:yes gene_type:complete
MTKRIGVSGAGIGGLSVAIALQQAGKEVVVFEQAKQFARVGADINLTPNAVRAIDGLGRGVGEALRRTAARPQYRISRDGYTGEETSRIEMAEAAQQKYGAPQLTLHRADVMTALEESVEPGTVKLGRKVARIEDKADAVTVHFEDGGQETVDVLIGADGIHSTVRTAMFGPEQPDFTGVVAYRAVVPVAKLGNLPNLDSFTKWWGKQPEVQLVSFPLNQGKDLFIFATTPQEGWHLESWTAPGEVSELQSHYVDFHEEARALLDACDSVLKSALYVRDPLPQWYQGRQVLLGDACHPMMPFMAQGAGQAIEDAVVLARCLSSTDFPDHTTAFKVYQQARHERTAEIQIASRGNNWLKSGTNADWVYGYDAWSIELG